MLDRAAKDAEEIKRGADEYAVSVLVGLEDDVTRTLQSIKKGIELLDERRAELTAQPAEDEPDGAGGQDEDEYEAEEDEIERASEPAAR
jgi:hypothetical protein